MQVIKGLEKEYENYVQINTADPYSKTVIDAGEAFASALDRGGSPAQAEEAMCNCDFGLTGFMAGAVIAALVKFHPRGTEVKDWWNAQYGKPAGTEGVVNPAIITID